MGNKIDIRSGDTTGKVVTYEAANKVVSDLGCKYIECSALTQVGLTAVFEEAIRSVFAKREE